MTSVLFALLLLKATVVGAVTVQDAHTEVELVPEVTSLRAGHSFWVALRMRTEEHWHTYWQNPGDSGLATKITWDLPDGFTAYSIQWPYPERIELPPLVSYGYEGEVFLLSEIQAPERLPAEGEVTFRAHVDWLACRIECLPGGADLSFVLPVGQHMPAKDARWTAAFSKTRQRLPKKPYRWQMEARADAQGLALYLRPKFLLSSSLAGTYFFPDSDGVIDHAADQPLTKTEQGYVLRMASSPISSQPPQNLKGVLVVPVGEEGPPALRVDVPVARAGAKFLPPPASTAGPPLLMAMLFAFVGGLILNLMPCVLPVLSLKVLSLVYQAGEKKSAAWRHGCLFALGILVSFWVLAGLMLILKGWGQQIGWGFQFQSPAFLVTLSVLFFVFALNLFGVFEIGTSLTGLGGRARSSSAAGAFFSGTLATIVATPCTAPFMGTAIGIAVVQPPLVTLSIFTFLGLGLAFPFLILSIFPQWLRFVPKPGPWIEYLKKFLSTLLFATVLWLSWVLHLQLGGLAVGFLGISLLLIGSGLVILSRHRTTAVVFVVAGLSVALMATLVNPPARTTAPTVSEHGLAWQEYSPQLVKNLRAQNKAVFIDFTAAWCLSCQVNERVALNSARVIKKFKELDVVPVKADWTTRDETITRALARFGKNSIPLYVLYGPDAQSEPVFLPEIITPGIVIEALERLE